MDKSIEMNANGAIPSSTIDSPKYKADRENSSDGPQSEDPLLG